MAGGSLKRKKTPRVSSPMAPPSLPAILSSASRFNYRKRSLPWLFLAFSAFTLLYVTSKTAFDSSSPEFYTFEVVNEFPHDPKAFTQGLVYGGNDTLFESTGLYGQSSVRQVLLQTGKVQASHEMHRSYFGEGLTLLGERLLQVLWMQKTGFVYDRQNLSKLGMFTHQMTDGWGLTNDENVIYGSDGTSTLYKIDPKTLKVIGNTTVTYKGYEVSRLNELEYVNGEVWANVWMSDCIARISHKDGIVLGWILLHSLRQGLLSSGNKAIDCLNGIAWDREKKRLFVTGKLWPKLYEIKLRPVKDRRKQSVEDLCLPRYY